MDIWEKLDTLKEAKQRLESIIEELGSEFPDIKEDIECAIEKIDEKMPGLEEQDTKEAQEEMDALNREYYRSIF